MFRSFLTVTRSMPDGSLQEWSLIPEYRAEVVVKPLVLYGYDDEADETHGPTMTPVEVVRRQENDNEPAPAASVGQPSL